MFGDDVEFEVLEDKSCIIDEILERRNFLKRPSCSNITQVIFVIASSSPKPNLLMLDKELSLAESLGITPVIVINKTDLDEEEAENLAKIYTKVGYKVIETNAEKGERTREIKRGFKK